MPRCSVIVCKNTSSNVNYVKDSISFHTYPKDPDIKEKWIKATGRSPNWFPTKNSSICSSHFAPDCFQPLKKVRRLFEWSVPTLKLRMMLTNYIEEPSLSKKRVYSEGDKKGFKSNVVSNTPLVTELQNLTCEQNNDSGAADSISKIDDVNTNLNVQQNSILENPEHNRINITPRKHKLREYISIQKNMIKQQKSQIKKLQKKTSRYKKKITDLRKKLQELEERNYTGSEHLSFFDILNSIHMLNPTCSLQQQQRQDI